jgi:hypothetical protein
MKLMCLTALFLSSLSQIFSLLFLEVYNRSSLQNEEPTFHHHTKQLTSLKNSNTLSLHEARKFEKPKQSARDS